MIALRESYVRTLEKIQDACVRASRNPSEITLVAVSKFHRPEAIEEIHAAGQIDFGENYLQEWCKKSEILKVLPIRWHMIGHLQSRKAKDAAGAFALLHTLDSRHLAQALQKRLESLNKKQDVLIEVNIGGEGQKSGVSGQNLQELAEYTLEKCPRLHLRGLMCLPPVFDAGEASRPWFASLRKLRDDLEKKLGIALPTLSMGMSGDFGAAIAEGATIVRIGSSIFGPRPAVAPGY